MAAFCRKVWRQNGRSLPYAFSAPNDCFDQETGRYLFGTGRLGLTCATFVIAVFQATGLSMIDLQSWPPRDEDAAWQRQMLRRLADHGAAPEHLASVQKEVGCARFRPEEVGGAAAADAWPATFEEARIQAETILDLLDRFSPSSNGTD